MLIDAHHHVMPPALLTALASQLERMPRQEAAIFRDWTVERSLAEMDAAGVTTAIASIAPPGIWAGDAGEARRVARESNEYMAEIVRTHRGRFGFFATLPLPDVEGGVAELEYALDTLGADGIGLLSNAGDVWPGDPRYAPVFAALDRRGAVVYVHASVPACCQTVVPGIPPPVLEFLFDTTRAIGSLLINGTFTRYPNVRFVFSHGGAAIALVAERVGSFAQRSPEVAGSLPDGVSAVLSRAFYDLATTTSAPAMAALRAFVPMTQLLFGSDYPFVPIAATSRGLAAAGLSGADRRAIEADNARRLLPRLRPV